MMFVTGVSFLIIDCNISLDLVSSCGAAASFALLFSLPHSSFNKCFIIFFPAKVIPIAPRSPRALRAGFAIRSLFCLT